MRDWMGFAVLAAAVSGAAVAANAETGGVDEAVAESRAAVKEFMGELKGELQAAIKAGGPVNAIEVCNVKAPQIAARIAEDKGWIKVARTSLKTRNPANAPDAWERQVLEQFEARKAGGEHPKKMEHHEVMDTAEGPVLRYMKAIPTGEVCLKCHGENIDPAVKAKLAELYPQDQATGFKKGDIRGAFTFTQRL